MSPRSLRIIVTLPIIVAALSCRQTDNIPGPGAVTRKSDSTLVAGLNVSAPVGNATIAAGRSAANSSAALSAEVSYVSLVPGTVSDGTTATVSNLRTAERLTVTIVDGGFDPQPIPASSGDTLQVTVIRAGGPDATAFLSVAARVPPRLVRTRPPRGQTDVPLNLVIAIVFSEPVDPASVNPTTVTLSAGTSPVPGEVSVVSGAGYTFEFTPSAPLAPLTTYSLSVSGVANLAGASLASPVDVTFTTSGSLSSGSIASVTLSLDTATLDAGSYVQLEAKLKDSAGRITIPSYRSLSWTSTAPDVAYVNSGGSVVAIGAGTAMISARSPDPRYPGAGTARITVKPATTPEGAIVYTFWDFDSALSGLYAVDPDGSNGRFLTGDYDVDPVWSPDGTSIAFRSQRGCNQANSVCHFDLFVVKANGTGLRRLTTFSGLDVGGMSWSPDGSRFAFAGAVLPRDLSSREGLYVVNADGSGLRWLVSAPPGASASWPDWSPDGSKIAYNVVAAGDTSTINVVDADGSNDTRISRPSASRGDVRPRWSPDGKRIAFTRSWLDVEVTTNGGVRTQALVMDANGSNVTPITPVSAENSYAVWSPDGSRLAVITDQRLDVVNADGSGGGSIRTMFCCAQPGFSWRRAAPAGSSVTTQVRVRP
jgi:Tol biopolymer transport system component